jgi:fructuronate reductase
VVLELAARIDPGLARWIADEGAFPSTMVDRIVPATTPPDIEALAAATGVLDLAPVVHEPFRQWVIEDRFVAGARPDLAAAGAQMVADVAAFERMKLRCLNATHSALAYLGHLAGHETIAEAVADAPFAAYCRHLWRAEIIPTLAAPEGVDLHAYADALLARYANPAIRHRTWQIAMDGSQKLPQRILSTIADDLAAGRPCPGLVLAVAGWMRYVGGVDERGRAIDVRDPLARRLRSLSDGARDTEGRIDALLSVREVFAPVLAADAGLRSALVAAYQGLLAEGARASASKVAAGLLPEAAGC